MEGRPGQESADKEFELQVWLKNLITDAVKANYSFLKYRPTTKNIDRKQNLEKFLKHNKKLDLFFHFKNGKMFLA